jgi:methylthioribose-1-phosphate isomerase
MAEELASRGVPVTVVLDSAVAHVMERVDLVLAGAVAVTEHGGIISQACASGLALLQRADRHSACRSAPTRQRSWQQPSTSRSTWRWRASSSRARTHSIRATCPVRLGACRWPCVLVC